MADRTPKRVYTKCFFCGGNETLFFKYYKTDGKWIKNPNEFWICEKCFKIKEGAVFKDLIDECYFKRSFF